MRECLYHPVHGYYSHPQARRFSDDYTHVDVHPIFGRLLARQFAEMWQQLDRPRVFLLVEAAAGTGRLRGHILEFAQAQLPDFACSTRRRRTFSGPLRPDSDVRHIIQKGAALSNQRVPRAQLTPGSLITNSRSFVQLSARGATSAIPTLRNMYAYLPVRLKRLRRLDRRFQQTPYGFGFFNVGSPRSRQHIGPLPLAGVAA
jgi:hypothetical protein